MENAQVCRRSSPPGHSLFGLATSDQWGCFTLFYLLRKPIPGISACHQRPSAPDSSASRSATAALLSNGSLLLPHLGLWIHEGHPV